MKALADAIVFSVTYISLSPADDDTADDDCDALESIAGYIQEATQEELLALKAALERALAAERALDEPRQAVLQAYAAFGEAFLAQ